MRDLRILAVQTRYALLGAIRSSRAVVFGILMPVFLLVLFDEVFVRGGNRTTHVGSAVISTQAYYTAGLAAYAIMLQTFSSLAITVTTQRETGQLKRLRGTPMPSWTFIASCILRAATLVVAMVVCLFLIGTLAFHVHLHGTALVGLVVYTAIGTLALGALGLAATIVCSTPDAASTIGPFTAVILSFVSGVFIPLATLPAWLRAVGTVFPLEHLAAGMQRGLVVGATGTGITAADLGVLAAWALGSTAIAALWFRWEPQAATA